MSKQDQTGQILFTGITPSDLLSQIEQLMDAKIGVLPKNDNNQSGYLSRKEVAKLLKITLPTLHDWTKMGYLKAYKMGTRVLYKETEVKNDFEKKPSFKYRKEGKRYA